MSAVFITLCLMLFSIPAVRAVGVTLMASAGLAALGTDVVTLGGSGAGDPACGSLFRRPAGTLGRVASPTFYARHPSSAASSSRIVAGVSSPMFERRNVFPFSFP